MADGGDGAAQYYRVDTGGDAVATAAAVVCVCRSKLRQAADGG